MYQRIYIDIVFMTNFLMDYMLLRLVGKFLHLDGKRRRCVISAAFGSFVSCLLVCVPFKIIFPAAVLIHGGCAFFMASFAFRLKKRRPSCKNHSGSVFHSFCGWRDLSGTGNGKNHDGENISAFSGRDLWHTLYSGMCDRDLPVWKKKYFSGHFEISGEAAADIRLL